jgi:hypothetical protein
MSNIDPFNVVDVDMDDLPGIGLNIESPSTGRGNIYDHEPGGHHPLHLRDTLHS